ncbi:MAG: hypothetical protein E7040_04335 [Lentisphaerae bacterium]|nr:hypothetical protein [Lentisphaerota bacterium]
MKQLFAALFCVLLLTGCNTPRDYSMKDHRIFGESVQNYYQPVFEENLSRYERKINAAKTKADALRLVREAQERVKKTWKFPAKKCPLSAQVLKTTVYPEFTVENVIFKSRENFTVTANFYLPRKRNGKVPAVLFVQGHSDSGKRDRTYVTVCENFCRRGIAVLSIDPIQQGERDQFSQTLQSGCVYGHNRLNRQLLAIGETMSDWRTYDGIRAVDYLLTRPEVDASRIGINGQSGGGTMTALIYANDRRLMAAAPSCYITTFCSNVQNELAVDGEQIPAGFLADGGEMADLLLARAPQPCRILAQKGDFFDVRGARKTYAMLKKIYTLLGKEENISITEAPGKHSYSPMSRMAAYEFFTSVFGLKNLPAEHPRSIAPLSLNCLGEKGVASLKNEKTVSQIAAEKAKKLRLERNKKPLSKARMKQEIASLLKVEPVKGVPAYRTLRMTEIDGKLFQRIGIMPEKSITATLFCMEPNYDFEIRCNKNVTLMLPHISAREELVQYFTPENIRSLFAFDPRGMGESEPTTAERLRRLYWDYGSDYHYASLGLLLDQPYIGRRVYDILCAIELLSAHGAEKITLKAFGHSRYLAVYAALLSDKKITLELVGGLPVTYENAFSDMNAPIPQSMVPYGILKIADIDELYRLIQ